MNKWVSLDRWVVPDIVHFADMRLRINPLDQSFVSDDTPLYAIAHASKADPSEIDALARHMTDQRGMRLRKTLALVLARHACVHGEPIDRLGARFITTLIADEDLDDFAGSRANELRRLAASAAANPPDALATAASNHAPVLPEGVHFTDLNFTIDADTGTPRFKLAPMLRIVAANGMDVEHFKRQVRSRRPSTQFNQTLAELLCATVLLDLERGTKIPIETMEPMVAFLGTVMLTAIGSGSGPLKTALDLPALMTKMGMPPIEKTIEGTLQTLQLEIPASIHFADLELERDPDGSVAYNHDLIEDLCDANEVEFEDEILGMLVMSVYFAARERGELMDPAQVQLIREFAPEFSEDALPTRMPPPSDTIH